MLFHVSEDAGISRFEPRPSEYTDAPVVWAIDDERLRNYLLPRDCPRVTRFLGPKTTDDDRRRFLGAARALVAIEESWLERVRRCVLYCYHLPSDTFAVQDHTAGYYVSRQPIVPTGVTRIDSVLDELTRRGVDVRVLPSLWALRDAVIASTLEFSIIRMRETTSRHVPANLQGRADPRQPSAVERRLTDRGVGTMVRNATGLDEVSLLRLDSVAQRDPARVQFIKHSVRLPECLIAEHAGRVAGYGVLEYSFFGNGFISMVYVDRDRRGLGIGRMLMEELAARCRTAKLFTSTNVSNVRMRALLDRLGYAPSGVIYNLDPGDPQLVFLLER